MDSYLEACGVDRIRDLPEGHAQVPEDVKISLCQISIWNGIHDYIPREEDRNHIKRAQKSRNKPPSTMSRPDHVLLARENLFYAYSKRLANGTGLNDPPPDGYDEWTRNIRSSNAISPSPQPSQLPNAGSRAEELLYSIVKDNADRGNKAIDALIERDSRRSNGIPNRGYMQFNDYRTRARGYNRGHGFRRRANSPDRDRPYRRNSRERRDRRGDDDRRDRRRSPEYTRRDNSGNNTRYSSPPDLESMNEFNTFLGTMLDSTGLMNNIGGTVPPTDSGPTVPETPLANLDANPPIESLTTENQSTHDRDLEAFLADEDAPMDGPSDTETYENPIGDFTLLGIASENADGEFVEGSSA
jgi:hypothetical protein